MNGMGELIAPRAASAAATPVSSTTAAAAAGSASAAATAAAATIAIIAPVPVTTTTSTSILARTSGVDLDLAVIQRITIEHRDSFFSLLLRAHLHKSEALRVARKTIFYHFYGIHSSCLCKQSANRILCCGERKIADVKFYLHLLYFPECSGCYSQNKMMPPSLEWVWRQLH